MIAAPAPKGMTLGEALFADAQQLAIAVDYWRTKAAKMTDDKPDAVWGYTRAQCLAYAEHAKARIGLLAIAAEKIAKAEAFNALTVELRASSLHAQPA